MLMLVLVVRMAAPQEVPPGQGPPPPAAAPPVDYGQIVGQLLLFQANELKAKEEERKERKEQRDRDEKAKEEEAERKKRKAEPWESKRNQRDNAKHLAQKFVTVNGTKEDAVLFADLLAANMKAYDGNGDWAKSAADLEAQIRAKLPSLAAKIIDILQVDESDVQAAPKRAKNSCGHCGKRGHSEDECWTKYPHKRPGAATQQHSAQSFAAMLSAVIPSLGASTAPFASAAPGFAAPAPFAAHTFAAAPALSAPAAMTTQPSASSSSAFSTGLRCSFCNKKGHAIDDCWTRFPDKMPARLRAAPQQTSVATPFATTTAQVPRV